MLIKFITKKSASLSSRLLSTVSFFKGETINVNSTPSFVRCQNLKRRRQTQKLEEQCTNKKISSVDNDTPQTKHISNNCLPLNRSET